MSRHMRRLLKIAFPQLVAPQEMKTGSLDYQLVILEPLSPAPALNVPRRKKIPSLEAHQPNEIALICPRSLFVEQPSGEVNVDDHDFLQFEKEVFPQGIARIVDRAAYTMPVAAPCDVSSQLINSHPVRHVIFPFNLREDELSFDQGVNRILIEQLFPNTVKVRFDGLVLCFHMQRLPSHSLPESIAGVPVFFTDDDNNSGPIPAGEVLGLRKETLCIDVGGAAASNTNECVLNAAAEFFMEHDIPVLEFHLWQDFVLVVLEEKGADRHLLPQSIARYAMSYIYKSDASVIQAARRAAMGGDWRAGTDCSTYDNLQPGVMLSSGSDLIEEGNETNPENKQPELLSSSGIMVADEENKRFMTVSSSNFLNDKRILHPALISLNNRCLGEIVHKIPHADIGLVKLESNEVFNNQPFQNSVIEQIGIGSLGEFAEGFKILMGTPIYINAPSIGYKRGVMGPWAKIRIRDGTNETSGQVKWVNARMLYFSCINPKEAIAAEGIAGTPVWDKSGRVLGVIRGNRDAEIVLRHWVYMIPAEYFTGLGFSMVIEGAINPAGAQRDTSPEAMLY